MYILPVLRQSNPAPGGGRAVLAVGRDHLVIKTAAGVSIGAAISGTWLVLLDRGVAAIQ